jgi:hypothetical protein
MLGAHSLTSNDSYRVGVGYPGLHSVLCESRQYHTMPKPDGHEFLHPTVSPLAKVLEARLARNLV